MLQSLNLSFKYFIIFYPVLLGAPLPLGALRVRVVCLWVNPALPEDINTLVGDLILLYMQDFISKMSAKNVFIIIKTCSASGVPPQTPVSGSLPPNPTRGSATGPRWGLPSPRPRNDPPAFQFSPDRRV